MSNPRSTLESKLLVLKQRFMAGLPQRFDELSAMLEQCATTAETVELEQIERRFHTLAGTAGTYGEMQIAALAAEGEEVCASVSPKPDDPALIEYLGQLLEAMRQAAAPDCSGLVAAEEAPQPSASEDPANFDERPHLIRYPADAAPPDASRSNLIEATAISKEADATIRTGRILCVEDDPDQSLHVATILQDAGYAVTSVANAASFNAALAAFRPDLILLDIGLPDSTGMDLAKNVREDPANATLPIVFLTGDRRIASRIDALGVGGDDYVIKPVSGELLLSVVAARLDRSRSLRAMIDRDGLTGVLNHAALMRRADIIASEARRRREEVALVMLDLDHFKNVNDRYGHIAGDHVLTSFTSFLEKHIRAGDEIGRYGGEEFVLLLRNISSGDAQALVGRLIGDFGDLAQKAPDGSTFRVTFSAGVAMCESGHDLEKWKRRADEALYSAKHRGRARVEAA